MGPLLHNCAEVHEPIKLSFGIVSVVSPGIGVLDGVNVLQGKGVLGTFFPTGLNGALLSRNV